MSRTTKASARSQKATRWLAAAACVALGAGAGLWVHSLLPRTYASSTSLLVLPTVAGLESSITGSRTTGQVEIETEVELARSAQVAQLASEQLDGRLSTSKLQASTTVTVPTNSTVLVVQVQANSAELARDAATAVADSYLSRRQAQADAEVKGVVESLTKQVTEQTARLQENSEVINALKADDTGARALADSQRTILVAQLADVNSRLVALQSGTAAGGEVITAAGLPSAPISPKLWVNVGAGLLVGVLLGGALLLVLEQRGRMRTAALRRGAVLRDLGTLELEPYAGHLSDGRARPASPQLSRLIRHIDSYRGGRDGPEVVVVAGAPHQVQLLVTTLNSAWVQDRGGNVIVVAQHGVLEALTEDHAEGVAEVLRGELEPSDVIHDLGSMHGSLVSPGQGSAQLAPSALRTGLARFWAAMRGEEQGVLVVLVPPLDSVEAQSVLRTAGRIVVAVPTSVSDEDEVAGLYEDIDFLGLSELLVGTLEVIAPTSPSGTSQPTAPDVAEARPAETSPAETSPAETSPAETSTGPSLRKVPVTSGRGLVPAPAGSSRRSEAIERADFVWTAGSPDADGSDDAPPRYTNGAKSPESADSGEAERPETSAPTPQRAGSK